MENTHIFTKWWNTQPPTKTCSHKYVCHALTIITRLGFHWRNLKARWKIQKEVKWYYCKKISEKNNKTRKCENSIAQSKWVLRNQNSIIRTVLHNQQMWGCGCWSHRVSSLMTSCGSRNQTCTRCSRGRRRPNPGFALSTSVGFPLVSRLYWSLWKPIWVRHQKI